MLWSWIVAKRGWKVKFVGSDKGVCDCDGVVKGTSKIMSSRISVKPNYLWQKKDKGENEYVA